MNDAKAGNIGEVVAVYVTAARAKLFWLDQLSQLLCEATDVD